MNSIRRRFGLKPVRRAGHVVPAEFVRRAIRPSNMRKEDIRR
jgi:hypothetical protein